jgi:hypothetical protein
VAPSGVRGGDSGGEASQGMIDPRLPGPFKTGSEESRGEEGSPQIRCSAAAVFCFSHASALLKLTVCLASQTL